MTQLGECDVAYNGSQTRMPIHFESTLFESFGSFPGYTGTNAYLALPSTNGFGDPKSQSIDLEIHSIGRIGNCCPSLLPETMRVPSGLKATLALKY